jgi:hypothetical protein
LRSQLGWAVYPFLSSVDNGWMAAGLVMVANALANELAGDLLQRYFIRGEVERAVRPLLAIEEFTAGR